MTSIQDIAQDMPQDMSAPATVGRDAANARVDPGAETRDVRDGPPAQRPIPLWLSVAGLAAAAAFSVLAAEAQSRLEATILLIGAAAAGGLGLFGLFERAIARSAALERAAALASGVDAGLRRLGGARRPRPAPASVERAPEPTVEIDGYGRIRALNAAARAALPPERLGARDAARRTSARRARDLLSPQSDPAGVIYQMLREAAAGRPATRVTALREDLAAAGGEAARVDIWPSGEGTYLMRWRAEPGAAAADAPALDEGGRLSTSSAPTSDLAWCRVGPTGRIVRCGAAFEAWLEGGPTDGPRPTLQSVAPDAARLLFAGRLTGARGAEPFSASATTSRFVGGPQAPALVSVLIAPERGGAEALLIAAPTREEIERDVDVSASVMSEADAPAALAALDAGRLFEEAPMGVAALSLDGKILRLNAAADRLLTDDVAADAGGLEGADGLAGPVGDYFVDWLAEGEREAASARLAAAARGLSGGGGSAFEAALAPSAGASRAPQGRAALCAFGRVETPKGALLIGYLIDVTEQRDMRRRFVQQQKFQAVGQMAGSIAHEFNNTLTGIAGTCEMLLADTSDEDPHRQDLLLIQSAAAKAARLIARITASSRQQTLTPKVADLNVELAEILVLARGSVGERYEVRLDLDEALWSTLVDVEQFSQVIMNLVMNASHAMPDGGVVTVKTERARVERSWRTAEFTMPPGEYVRIDVIDTGVGIPPERQAKIFEFGFTTKETGKGSGIGLAVCLGIIKQSNGFIFVESAVGEGTTFSIFLPRWRETAAAAPKTIPPARLSADREAAAEKDRGAPGDGIDAPPQSGGVIDKIVALMAEAKKDAGGGQGGVEPTNDEPTNGEPESGGPRKGEPRKGQPESGDRKGAALKAVGRGNEGSSLGPARDALDGSASKAAPETGNAALRWAMEAQGDGDRRDGPSSGSSAQAPRAAGIAPAPPTRRPAPPREGGAQIVLLVEDDETVRAMAARFLRTRGYEVLEADCGEAALEILTDDARRVDLMLSDVIMPNMDGPSVLRALGPRRPELRTVFMTGYSRAAFDETLDGDATGGRDFGFLEKPFTLAGLAKAVAERLEDADSN